MCQETHKMNNIEQYNKLYMCRNIIYYVLENV